MKKIIIRIVLGLVVILILAVLGVGFFLDGIIKRGIETFGPKLTKVDVKVDGVRLSIFSGSGQIKGLKVGNPAGFKAPQSISVGSAKLALKPSSVFSDKIIIRQIEVLAPEITLELSLAGNNLGKIVANVNESAGGSSTSTNVAAPPSDPSAGKKLQVDDFLIKDARVSVAITELGGQPKTVKIRDIHLTSLGTGPEGITGAELLNRVLPIIEEEAVKASATAFPELKAQLNELKQQFSTTASNTVNNLTREVDKATSGTMTNLNRSLDKATGGGVTNLNKQLDDLFRKK